VGGERERNGEKGRSKIGIIFELMKWKLSMFH
jgi:hypothetical protein